MNLPKISGTLRRLILAGGAGLILTGCGQDYLAERAFYKANKTLKRVSEAAGEGAQFEAAGDVHISSAIAEFERLAERYPSTTKSAESLFIAAGLRAKQGDFEGARSALKQVISNFSGRGDWAPEARFQLAQSYEMEGRWAEAEEAFWQCAENEPLHIKGLYAPLYITLHYKAVKDTERQGQAYKRAVEHYKRMLDMVGPIEASAGLRTYLALSHLTQGAKEEAREEWLSIANDFPNVQAAPLSLLAAAEVSSQDATPDRAIGDYQLFLERYPNHPLIGKAEVNVGRLYANQKDYEASRLWFGQALERSIQAKDNELAPEIKLLIARSFEAEGKWQEAEAQLLEVAAGYPDTISALQVPLLRFLHYRRSGKAESSKSILEEALVQYRHVIESNPRTRIATAARRYVYSAYTLLEQWDAMLDQVDQELESEISAEKKGKWLFLKALIAENRLEDEGLAQSLYNDFLTQFPDHALAQVAKNRQEVILSQ